MHGPWGHARGVVSSALVELAEDPEFFVRPPDGSQRTSHGSYCVIVGPHRRWASVCRLRLAHQAEEVARAVEEIRQLVVGIDLVVWNVGSSATPEELPRRLRELGLRNPDPPMDPICAGMALAAEPSAVPGVDVRRIATLEEHRAGLEIVLTAAGWDPRAAADERARAAETFERRTRRGGHQWLAWVDGQPVAFALAEPTPAGLYLAGGATLPQARGRGCYRALVRARWDEAVRLGTPGLAVQAQHGTSAPILSRLGFTQVASINTLQSPVT
jgi:GNAT superfamily N-acetyltransferase